MQRSGSQKVLLVIAILSLIGCVLGLLASIMFFFGGGFIGGLDSADVTSLTGETGLTQSDASGMMVMMGVLALAEAVVCGIEGFLGLRASKDASKIGPFRFLVIVSLVLSVAGIVLGFVGGDKQISDLATDFFTVAYNVFALWICNNIKQQANM